MSRRRYSARRRQRRQRRKKYNKYYETKMMRGNPRNRVFFFKRNVNLSADFTADADGADSLQAYTFTFANVPGVAEFTALFDYYRINMIKVIFVPIYTTSPFTHYTTTGPTVSSSTFSTTLLPQVDAMHFFTCMDYNSTSTLTIAQIREYHNCKVTPYSVPHKRIFRPRINVENAAGAFLQYGKNPWVASGDTSVVYFGLNAGLETSIFDTSLIAQGNILYRLIVTYYFSCKAVR